MTDAPRPVVTAADSSPASGATSPPARRADIDLLVALSNPWLCRDDAEQLRKVLVKHRGDIDWDWIINQAVRHRTLPLIGFNIKKFRLYRSASGDVETIPNH